MCTRKNKKNWVVPQSLTHFQVVPDSIKMYPFETNSPKKFIYVPKITVTLGEVYDSVFLSLSNQYTFLKI